MKKIVSTILCLMISITFVGCQEYDKKSDKITNQNESIKCDYNLQTLDEIRGTADEVIKQAQEGRWSNLKFDKFDPYISDEDEIYEILISIPKNYKGLEREALLNEEIKFIEHYFPNTSKGEFADYKGIVEKGEYSNTVIEEFRNEMKNNENRDDAIINPWILYKENDGVIGHRSAGILVDSQFYTNEFDFKKIKNTWIDWRIKNGTDVETLEVPGLSIWFCELLDGCYVGDTDGSLDKKWKLLNGEMSIREGIEFVENYVNNELPYETNPDIKASVYEVVVMKVTDDVYAFNFRMRREIYGLVTQSGWPVMSGDSGYMAEGATAEMIEIDKIDRLFSQLLTANVEKTSKAITQIIPLEAAIDSVSKEIGINSTYEVESIELAYDVLGNEVSGTGKPVWRFITKNIKSEYGMVFSVDVVTGEVKYRDL